MSEREHDIESRVPYAVLDAGQVSAAHPDALREVLLLNARRLAQLTNTATKAHMRRVTRVRDLAAHSHSVEPRPRPTANTR